MTNQICHDLVRAILKSQLNSTSHYILSKTNLPKHVYKTWANENKNTEDVIETYDKIMTEKIMRTHNKVCRNNNTRAFKQMRTSKTISMALSAIQNYYSNSYKLHNTLLHFLSKHWNGWLQPPAIYITVPNCLIFTLSECLYTGIFQHCKSFVLGCWLQHFPLTVKSDFIK